MTRPSIGIRIWDGCTVVQVLTVSPTGSSTVGAAGGAGNSTHVDIELDPWAGLVVDHRAEYPAPLPIRADDERYEPLTHDRDDA